MEIHPACGVLHEKTTLLFRDPVSVAEHLLSDPKLGECLHWGPSKLWSDSRKRERRYSGMETADWWWETQVSHSSSETGLRLKRIV